MGKNNEDMYARAVAILQLLQLKGVKDKSIDDFLKAYRAQQQE